jgi:acetyltransferase-like isoleucine patch superfamily enzyme
VSDPSAQPFIHETAVVEEGALLGTGTKVWHHAHVRTGAVVGEGCVLGKNVFVDAGVEIGSGSRIQNNVSVYRGVRLGRNVFVGPSAVFTNDRYPRATDAEWVVVPTEVGEGASIGANATIVCGVEIGPWSAVGAGAVVTHSVAAHSLVVGNPARPVGWVCRCGRSRASRDEGMGEDACPHCGWIPEAKG